MAAVYPADLRMKEADALAPSGQSCLGTCEEELVASPTHATGAFTSVPAIAEPWLSGPASDSKRKNCAEIIIQVVICSFLSLSAYIKPVGGFIFPLGNTTPPLVSSSFSLFNPEIEPPSRKFEQWLLHRRRHLTTSAVHGSWYCVPPLPPTFRSSPSPSIIALRPACFPVLH